MKKIQFSCQLKRFPKKFHLQVSRSTVRQHCSPLSAVQPNALYDTLLIDLLQTCVAVHFVAEEIGPVPAVIADAWGIAWRERIKESSCPVPLHFEISSASKTCELTLVGLFHRDAANLRFVREAVITASPDALALEARSTFLPSYSHLSEFLPDGLVEKLYAVPLDNLQVCGGDHHKAAM